LAEELGEYAGAKPVVLALPRGGVPVAFEVSRVLRAPLDVVVVRKLGTPRQSELAMGAVAPGGVRIVDEDLVRKLGVDAPTLQGIVDREVAEVERRAKAFRGSRPPVDVRDRTVILVDDGIATGSTILAAIRVVRSRRPARIVIAVPVIPREAVQALEEEVDALHYLLAPEAFRAIGLWYEDFAQTSDEEVVALLREAWAAESDESVSTAEGA
jgi:putative phosphoribosyl transferase